MSAPRIAGILYHEVTDAPTSTGFQRPSALPYKHTHREFSANLDAIARSGARPGRIEEVAFTSDAEELLLTFDDGGKSAMYSAELLSQRGWVGHFFATTEQIGRARWLTAGDLRDLSSMGHVIGSHSHTHPDPFRDQARGEMLSEWTTSKAILDDILGQAVRCASIPGGAASEAVYDTAAEAGLQYLFTSFPRRTPRRADGIWVIGRYCPKAGTPLARVEKAARFSTSVWAASYGRYLIADAVRRYAPRLHGIASRLRDG